MNCLNFNTHMCYSPLSEYEFQSLKKDNDIKKALNLGNVYLICQRPRLFFKDLTITAEKELILTIVQKIRNSKELKFLVPLKQKKLLNGDSDIIIEKGTYDYSNSTSDWFSSNDKKIFNNKSDFDGLKIYKIVKKRKGKEEAQFVAWLSPEKLIFLALSNLLQTSIHSQSLPFVKDFVKYDVLYIGRTNDMHRRQSKHEHVQEILSKEFPKWKDLVPHEICFISLKITQGDENCLGCVPQYPKLKNDEMYFDFEKAFVKAFTPQYNKDHFDSYPLTDPNCLHKKYNYDYFAYLFNIPVILTNSSLEKKIVGTEDCIVVSKSGLVSLENIDKKSSDIFDEYLKQLKLNAKV